MAKNLPKYLKIKTKLVSKKLASFFVQRQGDEDKGTKTRGRRQGDVPFV